MSKTETTGAAVAAGYARGLRDAARLLELEADAARDVAYATRHKQSAEAAMGRSLLLQKSRDAILALLPKETGT